MRMLRVHFSESFAARFHRLLTCASLLLHLDCLDIVSRLHFFFSSWSWGQVVMSVLVSRLLSHLLLHPH
jgi:hypothetical protein